MTRMIWGAVAGLAVYVCGGPFWLQCFAGFCAGLTIQHIEETWEKR